MKTHLLATALLLAGAAAAYDPAPAQRIRQTGGAANTHGQHPTDIGFRERTQDNGYGYDGGVTLFDVSLITWSIPGRAYDVEGLRLNLGAAENKSMAGLDIGLASITRDYAIALQVNAIANVVYGDATGVQIGLFNRGKSMSGLQIGLVNSTENLHGIQIGLINISQHLTLPILNIAF